MVKSITKKEFNKLFVKTDDKLVANNSENCIVKFSANWCQPCKAMAPILENISNSKDINVYEIDVDEDFELAAQFNIKNIPTTFFVSTTGDINRHVGSISQTQMEKLIIKYFG